MSDSAPDTDKLSDNVSDTDNVEQPTTPPATDSRGILRSLARWIVKRYYPRIEITNGDRIPQSGPALLCANHANSLVDPVLIGVAAHRPVRFMAKAPLFDMPLLGPVMHALGMVPAFRGSDDASQVRRNVESLDVGAKVLVDGQAMGIFPEGKSTDEAHVEMVRSGAARMAIQAAEDGASHVQVVPIGLNYERKDEFRSSVWIAVAEPIDVDACLQQHADKPRIARRDLTEQLEARLKQVVVHLDEPAWEPWLADLEVLAEAPREADRHPVPPLQLRKRIADAMNHFLATDRPRAESIASDIKEYRNQVTAAGLRVDSPLLKLRGWRVFAELLREFLWLLLLLVPAAVGTVQHLVPFVIVRALGKLFDQAGRKVVSTNRLFIGVPIYLFCYAVTGWWMFGYFANWFAWTWLVASPFCGIVAINYWRRACRAAELLWHQLRHAVSRKTLVRLRAQDAALRSRIKELAEEYAAHSPRPETPLRRSPKPVLIRLARVVLIIAAIAAAIWIARYRLFDNRLFDNPLLNDPLRGEGLALNNMSSRRVQSLLTSDERQIAHLLDRLDDLEADATQIQQDFADGSRSFANQGDNDDVRELMRRYTSIRQALLRIIWKYQQYAELSDQQLQLRTFLLDFTAAAALYEASLKFVHQFGDNSQAVAKLNEQEPNWGIPPGLYDKIRHNLASPQNIRMFELARRYYHQDHVQQQFAAYGLSDASPYHRFHTAIADAEQTIGTYGGSMSARIVDVAVADLGRLIRQVQYETQSAVSTWIGDFKIREPREGQALIDHNQLERLSSVLQPGDILLERRNWYLSNAFLPGYWPHGAVYVGTADDLRKLGLDQNEHVRQHWDEFAATDQEGHQHVIIEAVSEGVIFSSIEHSIGEADAVAVLRPNVTEDERKEAIARAFSFAGRPYDFEFDFETTDMLVCTEVVFRTYGGNSGPIQFPLQEILGRQTMPAINLARKYDEEYGTDNAQFEFVAFIDGDEQTESSQFHTDPQAFRGTVNRPASSFIQPSDPFALQSIGPLGWIIATLNILAALVLLTVPKIRTQRTP